MSPKNDRMHTLRENTILRLIRKLLADHPGADYQLNSKHHKKPHKVPDMPVDYYPDVVDFTNKVAYEVHVYGKRKEHEWSKMPEGWRGVNVFTVDIWQKDEVWVWNSDGQYVHINKDDWQSVRKTPPQD